MENKRSLPFIIILMATICAILLLGWDFISYVSGYSLITIWGNVWFVFIALLQIFSLITIILLLITSIWGLANSVGKAKELRIGNWGMKAINELLFTIFTGLVVLVFIFGLIAAYAPNEIGVSFGLVLYFIAVVGAFITYIILRAKGIIEKEGMFACVKFTNSTGEKKKKKSETVEVTAEKVEEKQEPEKEEKSEEKQEQPVKEEKKKSKEDDKKQK